MLGTKWSKLFEDRNGGYFKSFQPFFGYLGGVTTLLVVFFFNTASLWNGSRISVKATSAFVSPIVVLVIWILKKLTRRDGRRFKFFLNLSNFRQFERRLQGLEDLIYPGDKVPVAGPFQQDMNMDPIHEERILFIPNPRNSAGNRPQDPMNREPDNNNGPARLDRTNITLTPNQDNGQQDYFRMAPEQPVPVSPIQHTDIEHEPLPNRRAELMGMPNQRTYNYMLSPSSASSRGGLGNIHETEAELDASSMAGSEGSQTRLTNEFR